MHPSVFESCNKNAPVSRASSGASRTRTGDLLGAISALRRSGIRLTSGFPSVMTRFPQHLPQHSAARSPVRQRTYGRRDSRNVGLSRPRSRVRVPSLRHEDREPEHARVQTERLRRNPWVHLSEPYARAGSGEARCMPSRRRRGRSPAPRAPGHERIPPLVSPCPRSHGVPRLRINGTAGNGTWRSEPGSPHTCVQPAGAPRRYGLSSAAGARPPTGPLPSRAARPAHVQRTTRKIEPSARRQALSETLGKLRRCLYGQGERRERSGGAHSSRPVLCRSVARAAKAGGAA
jgi:hypothetical protein